MFKGETRGPVDKRVMELERAALNASNISVALLKRVQHLIARYKAQAVQRKKLLQRDEALLDLLEGPQFHKTQLELSREWKAYERDTKPVRETHQECLKSIDDLRRSMRSIRNLMSHLDTPQIRKAVRSDVENARANLIKIETLWAGLAGLRL